jgi:hypothetical protein
MTGRTYRGNPCWRGHDGTRYMNRSCVECQRISSRENALRRVFTPAERKHRARVEWMRRRLSHDGTAQA